MKTLQDLINENHDKSRDGMVCIGIGNPQSSLRETFNIHRNDLWAQEYDGEWVNCLEGNAVGNTYYLTEEYVRNVLKLTTPKDEINLQEAILLLGELRRTMVLMTM